MSKILPALAEELMSRFQAVSSIKEANSLHDALVTVHDVSAGLVSQPRFWSPEAQDYMQAGLVLNALLDSWAL